MMTDYAIRTIMCIHGSEKGLTTSKVISGQGEIPHGVLMKVLQILRLNNIVESHRGRGGIAGGYSLKRAASKVTMLDVIEIMEGPLDFPKNLVPEITIAEKRTHNVSAITREYDRISQLLREELQRNTLADIFEQ